MLYTIDTDRILARAAKNAAKSVAKNAAATGAAARRGGRIPGSPSDPAHRPGLGAAARTAAAVHTALDFFLDL